MTAPQPARCVKPGTLAHALQLAFDLRSGDMPRVSRTARVTQVHAALRCLDTPDARAFLGTDVVTFLEEEGFTRTRRGQARLTRLGVGVLVQAGYPDRRPFALPRAS